MARPSATLAFAALLLAWSCKLTSDDPDNPDAGSDAGGGDGDVIDVDGSPPEDAGTGGSGLSALCGKGSCNPDDPRACGEDGGAGGSGGQGDGGNGGDGGAGTGGAGTGGAGTGGAGAGGAGAGGAGAGGAGAGGAGAGGSGAGGAAGSSGGGSGGDGGMAGQAGAAAEAASEQGSQGCSVVRIGNQVRRECRPSGTGSSDAPCLSSTDCQAGLACVFETDGAVSRCRPYCCAGNDVCSTGAYCAARPLRVDATGTKGDDVPVCVPGDMCKLDDPFPCGEGMTCVCPEEEACFVARGDGTTACWVPGEQQVGEACGPSAAERCAWNLVCSQATRTCLQLCRVADSGEDSGGGPFACASSKCQSAATLPDGWGVCVGGPPPDAG